MRRSREASLARALTAPCLLRRPTNAASWRGALEIAGQRIRNDGILCSGRASASHDCAKGRAEAQVTLRCRLHRCDKGSDVAPYLPYLLDQPAPGQRLRAIFPNVHSAIRMNKPAQIGIRTRAGAWNVDFPGVSGKAPAADFSRRPVTSTPTTTISTTAVGAFISPSSSSVQSPLHATIFPFSETVLRTSAELQFHCKPIAKRCVGQRPPNRRASAAKNALG